jgi:hypothetical protein
MKEGAMTWTDQLGALLKQYGSGGTATQTAPDVHAHFDQVSQAAPSNVIADGLSAAFASDRTPAFGQMLSILFNNSNGDQKAGVINQLLSSVGPSVFSQVLSGAGLSAALGAGKTELSPEEAQRISPEAVQQLASHAQKSNSSIVDSVSNFYAQHPTLVKTLGSTALSIALAKIAQRQSKI